VVVVPERSDYTTGDRTKVGAYVDSGVYSAFRSWVEEQAGRQYAEVGTALERAMLEYMDDDRLTDQLGEIDAQTKKNEALLRQVIERLDSGGPEKEKANSKLGGADIPQGKSPGARRKREMYVIRALYQMEGKRWTTDTIRRTVREVAEVSSEKTVTDYVEAITETRAFVPAGGAKWHLDRDGAADLLAEHGIEVPEAPDP
jgi:hypothetical protein